jgi:hypothetical protein
MTKEHFKNILIAMVALCAIALFVAFTISEYNRGKEIDQFVDDLNSWQDRPTVDDISVDYEIVDGELIAGFDAVKGYTHYEMVIFGDGLLEELMSFNENGDIYIREKFITNDVEIVERMSTICK